MTHPPYSVDSDGNFTMGGVPVYELADTPGENGADGSTGITFGATASDGTAIGFFVEAWNMPATISPPYTLETWVWEIIMTVATSWHEVAHVKWKGEYLVWKAANPIAEFGWRQCVKENRDHPTGILKSNSCSEAYAWAETAKKLCEQVPNVQGTEGTIPPVKAKILELLCVAFNISNWVCEGHSDKCDLLHMLCPTGPDQPDDYTGCPGPCPACDSLQEAE